MLLFFHQKSWSPYPKTKTPPLITPWRRLLLRCPNLIEGQGGLAFESEGYVLFELRVNAALEKDVNEAGIEFVFEHPFLHDQASYTPMSWGAAGTMGRHS